MKRSNRRFLAAVAALALGVLVHGPAAHALTTLKQVQISNGAQIDLLFDGKVKKDQIKTEFFNDIIQLSLSDVAVYPAKISSVSGSSLTKIFAYQYAPKLVRCRLTVKGKAEDYKDHLSVSPSGRILTVRIGDGTGSDQAGLQSAAGHVVPGSRGDHSPAAKSAEANSGAQAAAAGSVKPLDSPVIADQEERALLERVIKSSGQPGAAAVPEKKSARAKADLPRKNDESDILVTSSSSATRIGSSGEDLPLGERPIAAGKPLPSPMRAFGKLALVLGIFGLLALGFKKLMHGNASAKPGVMGALSRFARKNLGREGKLIEVVSSHYLGPKKSIAVVKVAGKLMVLGITNESINLIAQLPGGADANDLDLGTLGALGDDLGLGFDEPSVSVGGRAKGARSGAGATAAGPAMFADLLNVEKNRPAAGPLTAAIQNYQQSQQARAQQPIPPPQQQAQAQAPAPAAATFGTPSVRNQIRSRLEGLKQL